MSIIFRRVGGRIVPMMAKAAEGFAKASKEANRVNRLSKIASKSMGKMKALRSIGEKAAPEAMGGFYGGYNKDIFHTNKFAADALSKINNPITQNKRIASAVKTIRKELSLVRNTVKDPRNINPKSVIRGVTQEELQAVGTSLTGKRRVKGIF